MSAKFGEKLYIALNQVYEPVKDESGQIVYDEVPNPHAGRWAGAPSTLKKVRYQKVENQYTTFGTNGKVTSLYDSPGKAARYAGKEGKVAIVDPGDCLIMGMSLEEQFRHCEERMLFWGQEADRLQREMAK